VADLKGRLTSAATAVGAVYAASGFALASWGSRLPAIQKDARLSADELGLVLLALSAGTVAALLLAGEVVYRLGTAWAMRVGTAVCTAGLVGMGFRPGGLALVVAVVGIGAGNGLCDVAMNVQGAATGRAGPETAGGAEARRRLMPRLHAAWSLGTVLGAVVAALAAAAGIPVEVHLPAVGVVLAVVVAVATRRFAHDPDDAEVRRRRLAHHWSGGLGEWRNRRTIALGLLALGAAFAEGSANEWLTLGLVGGYRLDHAGAAAGLGLFVVAMTATRFAGGAVLRRVRPERVLLGGGALVVVGTAVLIGGAWLPDAPRWVELGTGAAGIALWGIGAALGVPLAIAAAADEADAAPARVSVVSTISYASFLAGPPLLGALAEEHGYLLPLGLAPVVMLVAFALAACLYPLPKAMRPAAAAVAPEDASPPAPVRRVS
jgi:predicted MFS family arabinose efflux permease